MRLSLHQQHSRDRSETERTTNPFGAWVDVHLTRTIALIVLFALVLNLSRLWLMPISLQSGETATWWPLVDHVADGHGYAACVPAYFPFCGPTNHVTAMREPASVFLFAGIALLARDALVAAALCEVLLNLLIIVGIFLLARELAGARVGLLASFLWMLYLPPIKTSIAQVSGDLLAATCITWGLVFFLRGRVKNRDRDWVLAGICIGIGALARSALAIVPLVLVVGLLYSMVRISPIAQPYRRLSARPLVFFLLAFAMMVFPWLVRNYVAFGRPVIGTTLTGYNLYRENYVLPTGHYLHFVAGSEADQGVAMLLERRTDLTGTENEAQMDAVYREEALRIIQANPLRYVIASLFRFLMLWFDWSVPQAYGDHLTGIDCLVMIQQGLLLATAIVGLGASWRRTWPIGVPIVAVALLYMAVIARLYLLIPVMPLAVIISAIGLAACTRRVWPVLLPSRIDAGAMAETSPALRT